MSEPIDHRRAYSIVTMLAIALGIGYLAISAKLDSRLRASNRARINKAEADKLDLIVNLGNQLVEANNHVSINQSNSILIAGTASFCLTELHRNNSTRLQEEFEREELERAKVEARTKAAKEELDNKIAEETLKGSGNSAKAVQKLSVKNVNEGANSIKESVKTIDRMHRDYVDAANDIIRAEKENRRMIKRAEMKAKRERETNCYKMESNEASKPAAGSGTGPVLYLEDYNPLNYEEAFGKS